MRSPTLFYVVATCCVVALPACKEDLQLGELRSVHLAEDEGVPAIGWIRSAEHCYRSDSANTCEPEYARKYIHDGWGIHSQLGEGQPFSYLPSPSTLPLGKWASWEPRSAFDVAGGHHWQFVWSSADDPAGAPASAFLIHDGEVIELALEPTDAVILARPNDTAVLVVLDAEPSVQVLELDSGGAILVENRVAVFDHYEPYALLARFAGDDLLIALATFQDDQNILVYRQSDDDLVDTGVAGSLHAIWGDQDRTRLMLNSSWPWRDVQILDLGGATVTLSPNPRSACADFAMGDFLPSGDAAIVFEHSCPDTPAEQSWIVVSEVAEDWSFQLDFGLAPSHQVVGTARGLFFLAHETEWAAVKRENFLFMRTGHLFLLDLDARSTTPLFTVDLMPGGTLID